METTLFNIFWSLIGCSAFISLVGLVLAIDKITDNKIGNFIINLYKHDTNND